MSRRRQTERSHDFADFVGATWVRTVACGCAVGADLAHAEAAARTAYGRAWAGWGRLPRDPTAWVRQRVTADADPLRRVLALHHVAGLTPDDVALATGVPPATVTAWLHGHRAGPALDELVHDVAARTRPPAVADVVATAPRRRRVLGWSAAALFAVGGLVVAQVLVDRGRYPVDDQAAPLTAESLEAATSPWVVGWTPYAPNVPTRSSCLTDGEADVTGGETSTGLYRSGTQVGAERSYSTWPDPDAAREQADDLDAALDACSGPSSEVEVPAVPDAQVRVSHESRSGSGLVTWVAVAGDRVGVVAVAGAGDAPDDVRDRVAAALVAGLLNDASR